MQKEPCGAWRVSRPGSPRASGRRCVMQGPSLSTQGNHRRLLLVITDGEPSDIDVTDRTYLVEDARKAVASLSHPGGGCLLRRARLWRRELSSPHLRTPQRAPDRPSGAVAGAAFGALLPADEMSFREEPRRLRLRVHRYLRACVLRRRGGDGRCHGGRRSGIDWSRHHFGSDHRDRHLLLRAHFGRARQSRPLRRRPDRRPDAGAQPARLHRRPDGWVGGRRTRSARPSGRPWGDGRELAERGARSHTGRRIPHRVVPVVPSHVGDLRSRVLRPAGGERIRRHRRRRDGGHRGPC